MFRLIKLALYVAIGYKLYEYFQGVNLSGEMGQQGGSRRQTGRRGGGMEGQPSHPQNMTGPGRGRRVEVDTGEDTGGHTEVVGRGVVQR